VQGQGKYSKAKVLGSNAMAKNFGQGLTSLLEQQFVN